ncbi:MAG TPA: PrsW family intramembrane metalloprotease [Actinomycetota bacterium]|nr:PrsW family intramembrane metalloprotease [Actinomycetota bacterium]
MSTPPEIVRMPRTGWGRRTSLFQWRQPAFWVYATVVVLTALYAFAQQQVFQELSPSGWALSWALLIAYGLPLFLAIYLLDLYEREPLSLVIGALVWGAVAATALSAVANDGWGLVVARLGGPVFAAEWTAALTAPLVEETLKAVGVVLIYLIARDEMNDMMDGFVYGAMVGLGFAIVEDVFYFVAIFGGTAGGVLAGFYVRVVSSGFYGHVLYTGLAGMGIAYFVSRRGEATLVRRTLVAAGLSLAAVAGHFLWNSPLLDFFPTSVDDVGDWLQIPLAAAIKGLPLLVFVLLLVRLARRRERMWLEAALRSEADSPALTATELRVLLDAREKRRSRRDLKERAGPGAARLLKRLQREQVNLAMVRTRSATDDALELVRQRELCKSLRDALLAMPGAELATAGTRD